MQITGSQEISKWMGRKAIKQQSIQKWTLNLNWSDKKSKEKNLLGCKFNLSTSRAYNMVLVIEGKIV